MLALARRAKRSPFFFVPSLVSFVPLVVKMGLRQIARVPPRMEQSAHRARLMPMAPPSPRM
jgi:hypothetical protein